MYIFFIFKYFGNKSLSNIYNMNTVYEILSNFEWKNQCIQNMFLISSIMENTDLNLPILEPDKNLLIISFHVWVFRINFRFMQHSKSYCRLGLGVYLDP